MPEPVTKELLISEARYYPGDDAIVVIGECDLGVRRHQIHSSCFKFGDKDKPTEMKKLAKLLIGKKINVVFDSELDNKIRSHEPLGY